MSTRSRAIRRRGAYDRGVIASKDAWVRQDDNPYRRSSRDEEHAWTLGYQDGNLLEMTARKPADKKKGEIV